MQIIRSFPLIIQTTIPLLTHLIITKLFKQKIKKKKTIIWIYILYFNNVSNNIAKNIQRVTESEFRDIEQRLSQLFRSIAVLQALHSYLNKR